MIKLSKVKDDNFPPLEMKMVRFCPCSYKKFHQTNYLNLEQPVHRIFLYAINQMSTANRNCSILERSFAKRKTKFFRLLGTRRDHSKTSEQISQTIDLVTFAYSPTSILQHIKIGDWFLTSKNLETYTKIKSDMNFWEKNRRTCPDGEVPCECDIRCIVSTMSSTSKLCRI